MLHSTRRRRRRSFGMVTGSLLVTAAVVAPASVSGAATSSPGVSSHTITLGLITSLTGAASSEYTTIIPAAQARIALQNAHGGIDGRRIKLITEDDQSSPAQNAVASQALVSKGVFGVIDESPFVFGGYKVLQQAGVPVTGGGYDGTEWGVQPNTNMFTIAPVDPHYPANTGAALFMKNVGAKAIASFGYGTSPSSADSAKDNAIAVTHEGLKSCYVNTSIPFGSVATAPIALSMKNNSCDGAYMAMDANTNFAILTAAKQAGVNMKAAISATGYGQTLLDTSAASQAGQGTYFLAAGVPVELHTKGTKAFQAALSKYAHFTGVPNFGYYEAWAATDLMLKGLQMAGKHPTRTAFMKHLRTLKSYDATGVIAPVNLTMKYFGKPPPKLCSYYVKLTGTKFVPTPSSGKPVCGTTIPGSTQA